MINPRAIAPLATRALLGYFGLVPRPRTTLVDRFRPALLLSTIALVPAALIAARWWRAGQPRGFHVLGPAASPPAPQAATPLTSASIPTGPGTIPHRKNAAEWVMYVVLYPIVCAARLVRRGRG